jgi:hypothetical protein
MRSKRHRLLREGGFDADEQRSCRICKNHLDQALRGLQERFTVPLQMPEVLEGVHERGRRGKRIALKTPRYGRAPARPSLRACTWRRLGQHL